MSLMKRWMYATVVLSGALGVVAGLGGCSGKVESQPVSAQPTAPTVSAKPMAISGDILPISPAMSTDLRYSHAMNLFEEGSYEDAEKEFTQVCKEWPKFSKPCKHLARTQLKLGKFEEALENALDAAELNPRDGTIDNVIGLAYMELDDFDSAEAAFKSAIAKTPTFAWAYNNLGYLKIQKQDFSGAKDILSEGGKLDKAPAVLFNNLGLALEESGDTVAAKEAFAKAVEIDPAHTGAGSNLSRMEKLIPSDKTDEMAQVTDVTQKTE